MATRFKFRIFRGDSASYDLAFTKDGVVYPLTGCSIKFTAKYDPMQPDDEAAIAKSTEDGGVSIENAAGGLAVLLLDPSDTDELPSGIPFYCDVQVTTPGGSTFTSATGTLRLDEDVTKLP